MTPAEIIFLDGFDDPRITAKNWDDLLSTGPTCSINLTYHWLKNWWDYNGHGELLLIGARRHGRWITLAPLFTDGGMIFNLCPEDQLDFIGNTQDTTTLHDLLLAASERVSNFCGFQFYFIPETAPTTQVLRTVLHAQGLICREAGVLPSPFIHLQEQPDRALAHTRKQSLLRHERAFVKKGHLQIHHFSRGEDILPQLDGFFDQHVARRAVTSQPSIFRELRQRQYYRAQTRAQAATGVLRFTRMDFEGQPIAYHYGLSFRGRFLFGVPSFDVTQARQSPGNVLLRQLLLAALEEKAEFFDFGLGDEAYKYRFATGTTWLRTWAFHRS